MTTAGATGTGLPAPLHIGITIERTEPLLGTAGLSSDDAGVSRIRDGERFEGWLGLLRVLSDLTGPKRARER